MTRIRFREQSGGHSLSAVAKGVLHCGGRYMGCACYFLVLAFANTHVSFADDSTSKVREGLKLYSSEQYEEASKAFAAATESLEKAKSDSAAIAAFDEACALHRKGDLELARDRYLKAGLSQDKSIATSAHFNLGVIASDEARKLAGEKPETLAAEKRKEVIGELTKAIESYRHCLELDPKYHPARRNLEMLRQWIKFYSDRWREIDLQKRRDETNLLQFLEYLVATQNALMESTSSFKGNTPPNSFAEMKRLQSELREEIPYLKDKIDSDLRPKETAPSASAASSKDPKADEELERAIALLSSWADEANSKMGQAEGQLAKRDGTEAAEKQKLAADQLDQIWDAVVPFEALLANELAEQTKIARKMRPEASDDASKEAGTKEESLDADETTNQPQTVVVDPKDWTELLAKQEKALRKTRLLAPKAQSELAQLESQPKPDETSEKDATVTDPATGGESAPEEPQKIDPEAIKAGYQFAIEHAPIAVQEMESAVKQMGKRDREQAAVHTEEARRILQEIQDAQPKKPKRDQQDQQQKQDEQQEKKEGEQKNEDKQDSKDEKEKQDEKEKDKDKKEDKKSEEEDKKEKDKKGEERQEPKVSQNRIEEALRRVREREQQKRERDRELKARIMERVPVDKDW